MENKLFGIEQSDVYNEIFDAINSLKKDEDPILLDRLAKGLIVEVQRSIDFAVISGVMLVVMLLICGHPTEGLDEFKDKISATFPTLGIFLGSMLTSLFLNIKFALHKNKFLKFTKKEIINKTISVNSVLTPLERLSVLRFFVFLRTKLPQKDPSDFDEEMQRVISFLMEN